MSSYAVASDLYNIFGEGNVRKWADINNNRVDTEILNRIGWALDSATTELNERLRRSVYQFPLTVEPFPHMVVLNTCYLAGLRLYESRGLVDSSDAEGYGKRLEKRVNAFVYDILMHRLILDVAAADLPILTSETPFVVND